MAAPNLLESLANVLEDATLKLNLTLNLEEMWQATVAYSEKNPKRFLCLVFMFIYLVFNNWPALLVVTFLFLCLVYQVQNKSLSRLKILIMCRRWRQRCCARRLRS